MPLPAPLFSRWHAPLSVLAGVVAGIAHGLSRPGLDFVALAFLCFVPLFWLVDREAERPSGGDRWAHVRRFLVPIVAGWLFGFIANAIAGRALPGAVSAFFGFGPRRSAAGVALVCAFHALSGAALLVLAIAARRRGVGLGWAVLVPFVALEWGFPRLANDQLSAAVHDHRVLTAAASIGGPELVGMTVVVLNLLVYTAARALGTRSPAPLRDSLGPFVLAASVSLAGLGVQASNERDGDAHVRVAVVQPNHDPRARDDAHDSEARLLELSRGVLVDSDVDFALWPESATADPMPERPAHDARVRLAQRAPVLFGATLLDATRVPRWNSALLLSPDGELRARYDKIGLMPFSERLPLSDLLPAGTARLLRVEESTPGERSAIVTVDGHRVGVMICYEDVLPGLAFDAFGSAPPDLLVTLSNDAWYGGSSIPEHHFALARYRAIEWGRSLVRVTQTGVSVLIDARGEVLERLPPSTAAAAVWDVPVARGWTPYSMLGPWPGPLALLVGLLYFARKALESRRR